MFCDSHTLTQLWGPKIARLNHGFNRYWFKQSTPQNQTVRSTVWVWGTKFKISHNSVWFNKYKSYSRWHSESFISRPGVLKMLQAKYGITGKTQKSVSSVPNCHSISIKKERKFSYIQCLSNDTISVPFGWGNSEIWNCLWCWGILQPGDTV